MEQKRIEEIRKDSQVLYDIALGGTAKVIAECLSEIERLQKELDDERGLYLSQRNALAEGSIDSPGQAAGAQIVRGRMREEQA